VNYKAILITIGIILFLGIVGAAVYKIVQTTERYSGREQTFYSPTFNFAPLSFGCGNVKAEGFRTEKKPVQPMNKTQ
jgi:hypothetical protein